MHPGEDEVLLGVFRSSCAKTDISRVGGTMYGVRQTRGSHPSSQTMALLLRDNMQSVRQEIKARSSHW